MARTINVLIFPAGEINAVELHDALSTNVNIKVFGGSSVDRHGPFIFKNYITNIPNISENNFIEEFNNLIKYYEIDVIFPTHDSVATYFAENAENINAAIIAADRVTSAVCRDKKITYEVFSNYSFNPITYTDLSKVSLPVFVKPRQGQGSVGAKLIENSEELKSISLDESVLCEYLPGNEITVDCLTDKDGALRIAAPRSRDRTMAGVSVAAQALPLSDEVTSIASAINSELKFKGLWFFQLKKDQKGDYKLLEISTRCAGTMCVTRTRGANLPLLSVYVALGYDINVHINNVPLRLDRSLINRYKFDYAYDTAYLDFDDTLIIRNKVHLPAIQFAYQCKNNGTRLILITKHKFDLDLSLKKYNISRDLFDDVVHLDENARKLDSISDERAIFIDNSFDERRQVYEHHKIPVFDVDALEVLLDWRL